MIFEAEDRAALQNCIPGHIHLLEQIDRALNELGLEITGLRISDTRLEDLRYVFSRMGENSVFRGKLTVRRNDLLADIFPELKPRFLHRSVTTHDLEKLIEDRLMSTCSQCGSTIKVRDDCEHDICFKERYKCSFCASLEHDDSNSDILRLQSSYFTDCNEIKHKPYKFRVVNPQGEFEYSYSDLLRYNRDSLLMFTNNEKYADFDLGKSSKEVSSLFEDKLKVSRGFIIPVRLAGMRLKRRDKNGESIYTGDILFNTQRSGYGMAHYSPRLWKSGTLVLHDGASFSTPFDYDDNWIVKGNIILGNKDFNGDFAQSWFQYMNSHLTELKTKANEIAGQFGQ